MILVAVIPPLWRGLMDHRVLEHYRGQLARANVAPGLRLRANVKVQPRA